MITRALSGPGGTPGARRVRAEGRWWAGQRELLVITASLFSTAGITSLLGLAFWGLAAHLIPVAAVGYGSAAVSALTLVGAFGMAGLNTVLIGHLARQPRDANGVLAASLYASGLISAALATGFWLVAAVLVPRIAPYLHTPTEAVLFLAGSALTGVTGVLDEALLGLFGGGPQLWRNAAWAVTKLAALAGFALLWHDRLGTSILAAWTAGTALSVIPVVVLLRRRGVRLLAAPRWRALRRLGRDSASNTWLNNALLAPALVMPLVVTGLLSPAEGGAFYVAWNIVTLTSWLSFHFTSALYATGAADPHGFAAKLRFTLRTCMYCGLIGVPLVVVGAHPLLRLFGSEYAARAAVPLQWLMLGYFGGVLKSHYVALCRISQRITRAGVYATATCAARLAAACVGAVTGGLIGLSVALAVVMTAEGIVALPAVWRAAAVGGSPRAGPLSSC